MRKFIHIILSLAVVLTVFACKEKKKALPGEVVKEDVVSVADTIVDDTVVNEWGEAAPPPEVSGDGSSLFTERLAKNVEDRMRDFELIDDTPKETARNESAEAVNTVTPTAANNDGGTPEPRRTQRNEPASSQYATPSVDMSFDYTPGASSSSSRVGAAGMEVLPYAANEVEKIDFLKDFYTDCFAREGRNVDESMLSVPCRRYLQDKASETGEFTTGRFFRTQSGRPSKSWADIQKNMTVKSVGDDWYRVEMDEGGGRKALNIKVVEVDGRLKIDMVNNKNM